MLVLFHNRHLKLGHAAVVIGMFEDKERINSDDNPSLVNVIVQVLAEQTSE